jgi:hypothetical protein
VDIRQLFPGMPDDVVAWLEARVASMGWPPVGMQWYGVLRGRSVDEWTALRWERRTIVPKPSGFTRDTLLVCEGLHDVVFNGVQNEYSVIGCSRDKVASVAAYVRDQHAIPGTLIFLDDGGRLDVVDGCHRLMLYFALKARGATDEVLMPECDAWIGFRD